MADLPRRLPPELHYSIYADDVCIWASGSSASLVQSTLQEGLNIVDKFLKERGMELSYSKTAVLPFTRGYLKDFQLCLEGQRLDIVKQHKFLGVILDRQLSWNSHIKALEDQINSTINVLRRIAGTTWGGSVSSLLKVHNALIKQKIAYSSPVLHGISRSSEERLQRLIARSLRVCLGVPRATSSSLVIAEARHPPFSVMRTVETCRHYFRVSVQHKRHPLAITLIERDRANINTVIQAHKNLLPDHEFWISDISYPPWRLVAPKIELSIDGIIRKRDMFMLAAQQLALYQIYFRYPGYIQAYTDGSCQTNSSTAAFVIPEWNRIQTFKLSHATSSTTAELFAILSLLRYINLMQKGNQWVILCDSQAALLSLHGGISNTQNMALVYETLKELTKASEENRTIMFQWIPGHCNIPGNVAADKAAGQAHNNSATYGLPLTQGELRHILRQISFSGCKATWFDQNSKSSDLFHIDPALQFKIPSTVDTTRAFETLIHRLRLGTAYTKHFLQKISRADSPECTCGHMDEDIQHLLLECPRHDTHRQRLASDLLALDRRPFSLRKILGPWPTYSLQRRALMALQRFLEASNILGNY